MLAHVYFKNPGKKSIYYLTGTLNKNVEPLKLNSSKTYFVISEFNHKNNALHIATDKIIRLNKNNTPNHPFNYLPTPKLTTGNYKQSVKKVVNIIKQDKTLTKIVLAQTKLKPRKQENLLQVFQQICNTYNQHFCYLITHPSLGTLIGATPELLINFNNNNCHTVALAATKTNRKYPWGNKEKTEQLLVQQHLITQLNNSNILFSKSKLQTIKSGNLFHLKTTFKFNLKNSNQLQQIIKDINPTPAVAGLPVNKSIKHIAKLEQFNRAYYSGFIGLLNANKTHQLYVNLRCAKLYKNHIQLYAGAGITQDSEPDKEFTEIENKFNAIGSFF